MVNRFLIIFSGTALFVINAIVLLFVLLPDPGVFVKRDCAVDGRLRFVLK
jgi:hypothetical protein